MANISRNVIGSRLKIEPLTPAGFASFGDVIEMAGAHHYPINQGYAERFHDLARIDTDADGGEAIVSLFRGKPRPRPIEIGFVERHPLGSQAFYPLQDRDWLIVVAAPDRAPAIASLRAFRATGRQGINYARNVWHYPLLVLDRESDFLIIDRKGPGNNLEEAYLPEPAVLEF
ncbi:MAG: ureidoglycolate lyase [Parvibaculaceae bacterium]